MLEVALGDRLVHPPHQGRGTLASVPLHVSSLSCLPLPFWVPVEFYRGRPFCPFRRTLQAGVHSPALNFKILDVMLYVVKFALVCLKFNNAAYLMSHF